MHGRAARLVPFLPAVAFAATFGVFIVDKNREARTVLRSGQGLLAIAVIVVGYVLVSLAVRRVVPWAWAAPLVLTAVVLGLAAWTVQPYYVDETVERRLIDPPTEDVQVDLAPAGPAPGAAPAPVRVSSGSFRGLGHDASGTASIIRDSDGSLVVRFEDFDIEGVPDPQVHLIEGRDVRRAGGVGLGRLPGNQGQVLDFAVPASTDAGPGWTVLVWCRVFAVPVANATQA